MSLQTLGRKRSNRQFECSQLSKQTVPCDWTGDRETSATNGRPSSWDVKNAGGTRPQLTTARKSWNWSTKLTQVCRRQTTQTLVDKHGGFEYNSLADRKPMHVTQHRCDVVEFPCIGDQTSSGILDWLQFPQYTVAFTGQKTVAVIQAAADESMYEHFNCI